MGLIRFRIVVEKDGAKASVKDVEKSVDQLKGKAETPAKMKMDAQQALGTVRDVMLNLTALKSVVSGIVNTVNDLLNSSLKQKQATILTSIAFKDQAKEIENLASGIQDLTNHGDEELLPLMAKLRQTYKLTTDEVKELSPVLVDFADANASTGMTVATTFDLMGRAVNGHTEMLGRYGIELDKTRLKQEGVSYLVETLKKDYGGVSEALADLRLQNANTWGDIKEDVGDMLEVMIQPLLTGIKNLFEWFNNLAPTVKGFVVGLTIAVPVIGSVTSSLMILTTVIIALKAVINPVVGIISAVVGVLAAVGFGYGSYKVVVNAAEKAQKEFNDELERTKNLGNPNSIEEVPDRSERIIQLQQEIDLIGDLLNAYSNGSKEPYPVYKAKKALEEIGIEETSIYNIIKERTARQEELNDLKAKEKDLAEGLAEIDREYSRSKIEQLEVELTAARTLYNDISEYEIEKKVEAYREVKRIEQELSAEKVNNANETKRLLEEERNGIVSYYSDMETLGLDGYKSLVTELNAYLEKVKVAYGSESEYYKTEKEKVQEVEKASNLRMFEEKAAFVRKMNGLDQTESEKIQAEYDQLLEELKEYFDESSDAYKQYYELIKAYKENKEAEIAEQTQQIRDEAQAKLLDLNDQHQAAELLRWESGWKAREKKLIEAGMTEVEITELKEKEKAEIEQRYQDKRKAMLSQIANYIAKQLGLGDDEKQAIIDSYSYVTSQISAIYSQLYTKLRADRNADYAQIEEIAKREGWSAQKLADEKEQINKKYAAKEKKLKKQQQLMNIATTIMNTSTAIMRAYSDLGPVLGTIFGVIIAGIGAYHIGLIASQKFAKGGLLKGNTHAQGGIIIEAEGDEYITRKQRVKQLGTKFFDFINYGAWSSVKDFVGGMLTPDIPMPSSPSFAYAGGGQVGGSGLNSLIERMDELIDCNQELREELRDKKMIVHAEISANEIIRKADSALISEKIEEGINLRSNI